MAVDNVKKAWLQQTKSS